MAIGKITGSVVQDNTITESNLAFGVSGQSAATAWATDTLKVNIIESDDSTAIQLNDSLNISGTLSANTIDVNTLISSDSTGINIDEAKLFVNGSTVLTLATADDPSQTTSNADVDDVLINDGGVMKRIPLANINISSFNNDSNFASAAGSGFSASTTTSFPISNDSSATDYGEGEPDGVSSESATTDAFGVALGTTFDCMEPVGSTQSTDLGTEEAHVGA